jgi:hypothetical protein
MYIYIQGNVTKMMQTNNMQMLTGRNENRHDMDCRRFVNFVKWMECDYKTGVGLVIENIEQLYAQLVTTSNYSVPLLNHKPAIYYSTRLLSLMCLHQFPGKSPLPLRSQTFPGLGYQLLTGTVL